MGGVFCKVHICQIITLYALVHFKYLTILSVSYTTIKLGEKSKFMMKSLMGEGTHMSIRERWAQKMPICIVVTFLLFFFFFFLQAASKSMLRRWLEINTLLWECLPMGWLPCLPPCCMPGFLEGIRAPSLMNSVQVDKDRQQSRSPLLGLHTRPGPVFCFY